MITKAQSLISQVISQDNFIFEDSLIKNISLTEDSKNIDNQKILKSLKR